MNVTVRLTEGQDMKMLFMRVLKKTKSRKVEEVIFGSAEKLRDEIKARTPVKEGDLRRSIVAKKFSEGPGAFVAPDRSETLVRSGGEELELRTIGDKSWIRVGATWQEQEPPAGNVLPALSTLCADMLEELAPSLAAAAGEEDVVNGIETVHYRLDEAALKGLPELLGRSGEEGLPSEFGVDVWLERNDGWPVRLQIAASDTDEEGKPISEEWFIEFSDIDDPTIEIEPPPVSPAQT